MFLSACYSCKSKNYFLGTNCITMYVYIWDYYLYIYYFISKRLLSSKSSVNISLIVFPQTEKRQDLRILGMEEKWNFDATSRHLFYCIFCQYKHISGKCNNNQRRYYFKKIIIRLFFHWNIILWCIQYELENTFAFILDCTFFRWTMVHYNYSICYK